MKIIIPQTFDITTLVTNTIEDNYGNQVPWQGGVVYSEGAVVYYTDSTGITKKYESLGSRTINGTIVQNVDNIPSSDSVWWSEISYSNRLALFDRIVGESSKTTQNTVTIELKLTQPIEGLAIVNLKNYQYVSIEVFNSSQTYFKSFGETLETDNWYEYFNQYVFKENFSKVIPVVVTDIPQMNAPTLRITISKQLAGNQILEIGELIYGLVTDFGLTQKGIGTSIADYSIKETNNFGNTVFVERAFSKRISCQVLVKNSNLTQLQNLLYDIRAKPVVWIATDIENYLDSTTVYGYYKNFSAELMYPEYTFYNLEIEGLV